MVRFPGKEVYTDRYGPIPQPQPVSQDWGFEEASGEDAYLGLEDSGLAGLEQGQPASRANDEALLGDISGALGGAGDEVEAEAAKALADLKAELGDEEKSELVDETSLSKWRERAETLSQKLLKGTESAEEILEAVEELRAEWQEAVEAGQEAAASRDEGLSKPRKVDAKRKTASYDADPVASLRANYDDKIQTSEVTAGKVALAGATMADSFVVRFDEAEANGITIREYGFFGGDVQYVQSVSGDLAMGGVFHQDTNPTGEVLRPGYLYEVKNIPDFNKISDTRVELVGIIKI